MGPPILPACGSDLPAGSDAAAPAPAPCPAVAASREWTACPPRGRSCWRRTTCRTSTPSPSPTWSTSPAAGCGSWPSRSCSRTGSWRRRCGAWARSRSPGGRATPPPSTPPRPRSGWGECVAVFPEGTISNDLDPMAGKTGLARLAKAAGVDVMPVGVWGTHRVLPAGGPQGEAVPHADRGRGGRAHPGRPRLQPPGDDRPHHGRHLRRRGRGPPAVPAAARGERSSLVVPATGRGPAPQLPGPGGPGPTRRPGRRARTDDARRVDAAGGHRGRLVGYDRGRPRGPQRRRTCRCGPAGPNWPRRSNRSGENPDYLPGRPARGGEGHRAAFDEALDGADVVALAVPSHGFRSVLRRGGAVRSPGGAAPQPGQRARAGHR